MKVTSKNLIKFIIMIKKVNNIIVILWQFVPKGDIIAVNTCF